MASKRIEQRLNSNGERMKNNRLASTVLMSIGTGAIDAAIAGGISALVTGSVMVPVVAIVGGVTSVTAFMAFAMCYAAGDADRMSIDGND